jgi:imidazoleglycerol-phosphate dehydratase
MKARIAHVERKTKETDISIRLNLDGQGKYEIDTGLPFLDHMLELVSRHSLVDVQLKAKGDLEVDDHHTVEDIGLVLGAAFDKALGDRKGIQRFGTATIPMDETLSRVTVDFGGRPYLVSDIACRKKRTGAFDLSLMGDFFRALTVSGRLNMHITQFYGQEGHHAYESIFKALARALRQACERDPRFRGVPSSKGTI